MKNDNGKNEGKKEREESPEEKLLNAIQEKNKTRQQALIKIMKQLNSGNK